MKDLEYVRHWIESIRKEEARGKRRIFLLYDSLHTLGLLHDDAELRMSAIIAEAYSHTEVPVEVSSIHFDTDSTIKAYSCKEGHPSKNYHPFGSSSSDILRDLAVPILPSAAVSRVAGEISVTVLPANAADVVTLITNFLVESEGGLLAGQAVTPGRSSFISAFCLLVLPNLLNLPSDVSLVHYPDYAKVFPYEEPERLAKAIIHETGHNFGLHHCKDKCIMTPSRTLGEKVARFLGILGDTDFVLDYRSPHFCYDCRNKLAIAR